MNKKAGEYTSRSFFFFLSFSMFVRSFVAVARAHAHNFTLITHLSRFPSFHSKKREREGVSNFSPDSKRGECRGHAKLRI